jgi:hypothetical protein
VKHWHPYVLRLRARCKGAPLASVVFAAAVSCNDQRSAAIKSSRSAVEPHGGLECRPPERGGVADHGRVWSQCDARTHLLVIATVSVVATRSRAKPSPTASEAAVFAAPTSSNQQTEGLLPAFRSSRRSRREPADMLRRIFCKGRSKVHGGGTRSADAPRGPPSPDQFQSLKPIRRDPTRALSSR